jgi:hypothetical protein
LVLSILSNDSVTPSNNPLSLRAPVYLNQPSHGPSALYKPVPYNKPYLHTHIKRCGPGQLSRYSDSLRAGRTGHLIPVEARFSAQFMNGPGGPTQPPVQWVTVIFFFGGGGGVSGRGVTLAFWSRNYFFLILAHPVYKM